MRFMRSLVDPDVVDLESVVKSLAAVPRCIPADFRKKKYHISTLNFLAFLNETDRKEITRTRAHYGNRECNRKF